MTDPLTLALVLIIGLCLLGHSVGLSMIAGSFTYLLAKGYDPSITPDTILQGLYNGYTLLAIPLFILAANIMNTGSITDRLLAFCLALVGRFRGGLGHVNVIASLVFSGMSGSAIADAAGMGKIIISMMTREGRYSPAYAAAITAATATIGPIIPPSIPMVLYALVSDQSVGYLFLAGIAPGLLMAVLMGLTNYIIARRRDFPVEAPVPLRDMPRITFRALPALMLPVVLLGGIYGGVMTPTEAAAVAAAYALLISATLYRSVGLREFYGALLASARSTASVGILLAGALALNYVITRENLPNALADFLLRSELSGIEFLIAANLLIFLLGMILDGGAILLIFIPILMPSVNAIGIDPIHFGVIAVVNTMLGLITPPYGLLLFIVANISGARIGRIILEVIPFIAVLIVALAVLIAFPGLTLLLPRLFGYQG
ncbi:MAG: TRAP transporter large permease [Tropicimonas sp.]|uniref:TRAP transporter large permease n=1 Tax=Tropicimonas sp. TaxID=2067044 RepID=UPI003A8B51DB